MSEKTNIRLEERYGFHIIDTPGQNKDLAPIGRIAALYRQTWRVGFLEACKARGASPTTRAREERGCKETEGGIARCKIMWNAGNHLRPNPRRNE